MSDRTDKDYAIEFGEYLATAAEAYLELRTKLVSDEDIDIASDLYKGLTSAIYEFRKRAAKAKP